MATRGKRTPRGRARHWQRTHRGLTEQPYGSNTDHRKDGIRDAQVRLGSWLVGLPWCGVWAANAARAGGVQMSAPYRWASVAAIEDDARGKRNGFTGWVSGPIRSSGSQWTGVDYGDAVVLFGRGVHVEMIRSRSWAHRKLGYIITDGGNTSPEGGTGSQANGGGSYRRVRRLRDIHGIAKVNYPT